jgi:uncharacterized membrane protein
MFDLFFLIHILAIMAAFGPTFTFPMIAAMNKKDPKQAPFAARLILMISYRYTIPMALVAGAAGVGMILKADIKLFDNPWLWIAIIIYLAAVVFAITIQGPTTNKLVELTSKMAGAGPPPEGAPSGPPPVIAALAKKMQMGDMALSFAVVVIMVLMVFKPGAAPNLP